MNSNYKIIFSIIVFVFSITGCQERVIQKFRALGSPGEVLYVTSAPDVVSPGLLSVKSYFDELFPALPRNEKLFKVTHIRSEKFSGHLKSFRNILFVKIDDSLANTHIRYSQNRWADYQQIVEISAPDEQTILSFIEAEWSTIRAYFYQGDVERIKAIHKATKNSDLINKINDEFGAKLIIPKGYKVKKDTTGFLWMQYDHFEMSSGVFVYDTMLGRSNNFKETDFLEIKSEILKANVKGIQDGSYMEIETLMPHITSSYKIDGVLWTEIRGLWRMKGDMMGGGYVSLYTIVDNRLVVVDAFLYAPGEAMQASKLRALDAILRSVSFTS